VATTGRINHERFAGGIMLLLTQMIGKEVLPLKSDCGTNTIEHPCQACNGFNDAVSQLDKVGVVVDREKLAKILSENIYGKPELQYPLVDKLISHQHEWLELKRSE
jgi:hypothetical protein